MAQNNHQQILNLESELNCLKREREVMVNEFERKRRALLDELRSSTSTQRNVQLVNEIGQLNSEHTRRLDNINGKIFQARQDYFKLLRS